MVTARSSAVCAGCAALLVLLGSAAAQHVRAAEGPEAAAQAAAASWLELVDGARYAVSWTEASTLFRNAVTQDQWTQSLTGIRSPLGTLVARTVSSRRYAEHLPGAPDGKYVVLQYDTVFEHKATAVETVTMVLEKDDTWRAAGYFIR